MPILFTALSAHVRQALDATTLLAYLPVAGSRSLLYGVPDEDRLLRKSTRRDRIYFGEQPYQPF